MWIDAPPRKDGPFPAWKRDEHGHGYWLNGRLMGHVDRPSRGDKRVYAWGIEADPKLSGEDPTLRAAKRRVEVAFRRAYSWMYPESRERRGF
jgi:hypothetical protein